MWTKCDSVRIFFLNFSSDILHKIVAFVEQTKP